MLWKSEQLHHPTGHASAVCRPFEMTYVHPLRINNIRSKIPRGMANTVYKVKVVTLGFENLFIQVLKSECSGSTTWVKSLCARLGSIILLIIKSQWMHRSKVHYV
jgi:hypothetical protein